MGFGELCQKEQVQGNGLESHREALKPHKAEERAEHRQSPHKQGIVKPYKSGFGSLLDTTS